MNTVESLCRSIGAHIDVLNCHRCETIQHFVNLQVDALRKAEQKIAAVVLRKIEEAGTPAEGVQDWRLLQTQEDWTALEKELTGAETVEFEPAPTEFPCFVLARGLVLGYPAVYEMAILTFGDVNLMLGRLDMRIGDVDAE